MNEKGMKTTWSQRLMIRLGACALGVLFYWLLGFVVSDIRSMAGPEWATFEARYVNPGWLNDQEARRVRLADLERKEKSLQESLRRTADASANLQGTVRQLVELQKLSTERQVALSDQDRTNLAATLEKFLVHQEQYQAQSADLMKLASERRDLEEFILTQDRELEAKRQPARKEYTEASTRHRLRLAGWQLALLLPLLAAAAWLVARRRESPYFLLSLAVGAAILAKVVGVVHEYFPRRIFNYLLISALILVVIRLLIHFIRQALNPKPAALLEKYREAYERFLCPVCDHPIRSGPRRFLYWTRRTVNKVMPPTGGEAKPEPYACPSCGTSLFRACEACGGIRHSLLPHCEHCGGAGAKSSGEAPHLT